MSDTNRIARLSIASAVSVPESLLAGVWDAAWGCALFISAMLAQKLRSASETLSLWVLFALLIATAAFNRDFSRLGIGPLYPTELCLAFLTLTNAVLLYQKRKTLFPTERAPRYIVLLLLAFLMLGALRLAAEVLGGLSASVVDTLRNCALVYYAAFAVIAWVVLQNDGAASNIKQILAVITIVSTLTNLWTVIRYLLGIPLLADETEVDVSKIIPGHAVVFAMLSLLTVIYALRGESRARPRLYRYVLISILLLNILFIYLSGHRSAILGCIVAATTMLTSVKTKFTHRLRWSPLLTAGILITIAWHFLSGYLVEFTVKYATMLDPLQEANAAWRAAFWLNILSLWLSSPIFGVGFSHDFFIEEPLHLFAADHYDPHNSYLAILARTGIVGLAMVAMITILVVTVLIRTVRRTDNKETALLAGCLLSCFTALATFASMNVTLESPYHAIFFWFLIGASISLAGTDHTLTKRPLAMVRP